MIPLTRLTVPTSVTLKSNLSDPLPTFEGDASQIGQILMNLILNASEAIGKRDGVISVVTGSVLCDKKYLNTVYYKKNLTPGMYVFLEVSDTGDGMDKETLSKIFDPFFTTKSTGHGLGLATVFGIVRSHNGGIQVYSEVGKGTSFKILFPAQERMESVQAETQAGNVPSKGTVLLIDDDRIVIQTVKAMLIKMGYSVLLVADGKEDVDIFYNCRDVVNLVISDMTMPVMTGDEVFRKIRELDRDVNIVLMSGFNEHEIKPSFAGRNLNGYLQKPFTYLQLTELIRSFE